MAPDCSSSPQCYEISRLKLFRFFHDLTDFSLILKNSFFLTISAWPVTIRQSFKATHLKLQKVRYVSEHFLSSDLTGANPNFDFYLHVVKFSFSHLLIVCLRERYKYNNKENRGEEEEHNK